MGLLQGKALYHEAATPVLNLSFVAIEALWNAFNDIADGFGLTLNEFQEICAELTEDQGIDADTTKIKSERLFRLLDTDENELIDAIEFLSAVIAASGLADRDKIEFLFMCFDFDGNRQLTIDEVELAMRSTLVGLHKLSGVFDGYNYDEGITALAMEAFQKSGVNDSGKLSIFNLVRYFIASPECRSLISHYGNPDEKWDFDDSISSSDDVSCEPYINICVQVDTSKKSPTIIDTKKSFQEKQWVQIVDSLVPSQYSNENFSRSTPPSKLKLEWIHGYHQSEDCKNNVRYTSNGDIFYHAAAVGIIYDVKDNKQRYNIEHTGQIISHAMHPEGLLVATGEIEDTPKIIVWDVNTMRSISIIRGFHKKGVSHLAFNARGNLLACVGSEDEKCLSVYDWKTTKRIFSSRMCALETFDVAFGKGDVVVTCGVDHVNFWAKEGKHYTMKSGIFQKRERVQTQLCIVPCGGKMISGTADGYVFVWAGRNCVKSIKAHDGGVNALHVSDMTIISGSEDGKICLWTLSLKKGSVFDLREFGYCSGIRSVGLSRDTTKILVGTTGSEIYEISAADGADIHGGAIVKGHFGTHLNGMAVHPLRHEYCTVGDDKSVRIFDISTKSNIKTTFLHGTTHSVAYFPNGDFLVIGINTDETSDGGSFVVLKESDLTIVHEAKDFRGTILDIKFSMDAQKIAFCSADRWINIYRTSMPFKVMSSLKHKCPFTDIDFSEDGNWIQALAENGELVFLSLMTENKIVKEENLENVKDVAWYTQTCPTGWPTLGAWTTRQDGAEIYSSDRNESETVLVVGDSFGRVRLVRFPCCKTNACSHDYFGHAGSLAGVRFANGDSHVVSAGRTDRCVFQWKHEEADSDSDGDSDDNSIRDDGDKREDNDTTTNENELSETRNEPTTSVSANDHSQLTFESSARIPDSCLQLEFIYGYGVNGCRSNLKYSANGALVYHAANAGIVHDPTKKMQSHNLELTGTCTALAISSCRRYVATGCAGDSPAIVVWDSTTAETLQVLRIAETMVSQLSFSSDGTLLASAEGRKGKHIVCVYQWRDCLLKCRGSGGARDILGLEFSPGSEANLLQFGVNHVQFLNLDGGRNLDVTKASGRKGKPQNFVSGAFLNEFICIVGAESGFLYLFDGTVLSKTVKAHEGPVNSICSCDSEQLLSGGKDGLAKLWRWKDNHLKCLHEFDLKENSISNQCATIWSLDVSKDASKVLIGTQSSEIYEFLLMDAKIFDGTVIMSGHREKVNGLATNPSGTNLATVSNGTLRIYDVSTFQRIESKSMDVPLKEVCYSHDGKYIAIGTGTTAKGKKKKHGTFLVLKSDNLNKLYEGKDGHEDVTDIKYSPDDKTLAVASIDCNLYLYNATEGYTKRAVLQNPNGNWVTRFDFTVDSLFLQMFDNGRILTFADCAHGRMIPSPSALTKFRWASHTAFVGSSVSGFYAGSLPEAESILACAKSNRGDVIVSVDALGRVCLWQYPCDNVGAGCLTYYGHSMDVTTVSWSFDDTTVFTVGDRDSCVFQWRYFVPPAEENATSNVLKKDGKQKVKKRDGKPKVKNGKSAANPKTQRVDNTTNNEELSDDWHWMEQIMPPSKSKKEQSITAPSYEVQLDFVHGCRVDTLRSSTVQYNAQCDILYVASGVGIVAKSSNRSQQFHAGHRGDVTYLTVSCDGRIAATCDNGSPPSVHTWDALTGRSLTSFSSKNVCCYLAFSPDGNYLASLEHGDRAVQNVVIYRSLNGEWSDGIRIASVKNRNVASRFALFAGDANFPLMLGGENGCSILLLSGKTLFYHAAASPVHSSEADPLLCGCTMKDETNGTDSMLVATGTETGYLQQRSCQNNYDVVNTVKANNTGAVLAVAPAPPDLLISADENGQVYVWDSALLKVRSYRIDKLDDVPFQPLCPSIHSVCSDVDGSKILIGLKGGELLEIVRDTGRTLLLAESHTLQETHGLSMHPTDPHLYATSGDDAFLRIWDVRRRTVLRRKRFDCGSRALAWSRPDGKFLCVGLGLKGNDNEGTFMIVNSLTLEVTFEDRKSKKPIRDIKYYGPPPNEGGGVDGTLIGMASDDGCIYIHDTLTYRLKTVTKKQSSSIASFDFSNDGVYIRAATDDFRLVFFEVETGSVISIDVARDVSWNTHTCPYGWDVRDIWQRIRNGSILDAKTITSLDVSRDKQLVAYGCDDGTIGISHFPASEEDTTFRSVGGNSDVVSKLRFNATGDCFVVLGRYNHAILQYRLITSTESSAECLTEE